MQYEVIAAILLFSPRRGFPSAFVFNDCAFTFYTYCILFYHPFAFLSETFLLLPSCSVLSASKKKFTHVFYQSHSYELKMNVERQTFFHIQRDYSFQQLDICLQKLLALQTKLVNRGFFFCILLQQHWAGKQFCAQQYVVLPPVTSNWHYILPRNTSLCTLKFVLLVQ